MRNKFLKNLKNKYVDFTYKHLDFIKNDKTRLMVIPCFLFVVLFVVLAIGMNTSTIMGNSVIASNYYCEDTNYEVRGSECVREVRTSSILLGDVNLDNKINNTDATTLSKYLNNSISLSENQKVAADVNQDGLIDSNDHNTIVAMFGYDNSSSGSNVNSNNYGNRVCPKSQDGSANYQLKDNVCIKTYKTKAVLRQTGNFVVKYDSNGGISNDSSQMTDSSFDLSKKNKLQKNKYVKYKDNNFNNEPYLFAGWNAYNLSNNKILCYSNASHSNEEWITKNDDQNPLIQNGNCKYGMYLFEDEEEIDAIALPNETIQMKAVWKNFFSLDGLTNAILDKNIDKKNVAKKYNVGGFEAIRLEGSTNLSNKKNTKDEFIQDLVVDIDSTNKEKIFLSQNLSFLEPHKLFITSILDNDSSVFAKNISKCGIGSFDIVNSLNNGKTDLFLSCDSGKENKKNNKYGSMIYKIDSQALFKNKTKNLDYVIDGVKGHSESIKIDTKNKVALIRSLYDNEQHFLLYRFDTNNHKIDKNLVKEITIKPTNKTLQGYDISDNYLYLYYGDSSNDLTSAYIDIYNLKTAKIVKKSKVYEYKKNNIYMEARGISVAGNYVYIGMNITSKKEPNLNQINTIGDSSKLNYKYALVYKIAKSKLIN